MSETQPLVHLPSTRTGWIFAPGAAPEIPAPFWVTPAASPATCVPCQDEGRAAGEHSPAPLQSPSSWGLASRRLPSRERSVSLMKSRPGTTLEFRSPWEVMPVSSTAMVWPLPRERSHARVKSTPPCSGHRLHWKFV